MSRTPSELGHSNQNRVEARVHGSLNDFLKPERRGRWFTHAFDVSPSVKDVVESLGIPHPEVGAIVVDGAGVGFEHRVEHGARIEVFPFEAAPREARGARLAPDPPRTWRFVVDVHLGRLARLLRLLGFDTDYRRDAADAELAARSRSEERVLLTRDRGLLKRSEVVHGYCVRHDDPEEQVVEVLTRYGLRSAIAPFTRCLDCGGALESVEKQAILDELQPGTREAFDEFRRCQSCGKIFWRGSHHERLQRLVDRVIERLE